MAQFIKACNASDIADGSMKTCILLGKSIAIANIGGEFFATEDLCTHEECSLGTEGFLDANVVTCGCHGAQFDLTNGKVLMLPATVDLKTYNVKKEGSTVLVEV